MLAVLSLRQRNEIEIYAGLEPIGGMIGVSEPKTIDEPTGPETEDEARQQFERIRLMLGADE